MSEEQPVRGAGGGGKPKAPPAPYEAPNSLITTNTLRTLHLIGEGVLEGLVDGGKSIYLNDTPLVAADGSANVQGVGWEWRDGSSNQSPIEGFPTVETPVSVGVEVTTTSGPVTRTVNLTAIDRVRIIVQVNGLLEQRDNGDLVGSEVRYRVEYRATGSAGAWTVAFDDTISGKTTSQYQRSISFSVAVLTGSYDIRVTKLTTDSTTSKVVNGLFWFNYTTIVDQKLSYPGSALVGLALDAKNVSGSVPTLTFEVKGLRCWVPTNYDPTTRAYATSGAGTSGGMWDGTFKRAYTDNPAWIAYTLCVEPDFGIGREIGAAGVDKWSLYAIAQYCDELVPNGFGGTEPRYTFNAVINQRDEAFRVLQAVASSFRAMVYWGGGQVVFVADMPASPVKLVTPANVVEGRFEYEGASMKVRHSVAKIRWRDPSLGYKIAVEVVDDAALIAEVGIREIEIDGIGVTSRGLARRLGRWILYSEKYETDIIRYRAAFDHADVRPGQVILVQDPSVAAVAFSGRLAAVGSATSVTLDRPVTLASGQTYALRVALPDGTISNAISVTGGAGTRSTLTLGSALPALPAAGAVWTLVASNVAPTQWRVISVAEEADGTYAVTALRHFPGKYALVEQGLALNDDPFTLYPRAPTTPLAPPANVDATEFIGGIADTALLGVTVSWTAPTDPRVIGYEVQAVQAGRVAYEAATSTRTSLDFRDMVAGTYVFQVRSIASDQVSAWVATSAIAVDGLADPPTAPTSLAAAGAIRQNIVTWTTPTGRHYRTTEVWASSSATFSAGGKVGESDRGQFVHTGLLPNTQRWYWVRAADAFGQFSAWVGPVSATTSLLVAADITDGILNTAKFAAGIKPVAVPTTAGELATLRTTDQIIYPQASITDSVTSQALDGLRLYRWNGSQWVAVVSAAEISGQITSDQIAALAATKLTGQIAQTQITDGAISTPKLAAGAVTTATLAAGAVTTNKLAVVPQTLNPDPYFQDPSAWIFPASPAAGWFAENAAPGGNASATLGVPRSGTLWSGLWPGTGESSVVSVFTIPVTVGERLAVKARGFNSGNKTVYAAINYHNAAGAYLSSLSVEWVPGAGVSDKETQGVVPANAAYASVVLSVGSGAAWSGTAAISAVTVFRPATASMVVDGAITADKIATAAITADKVSANAITAGKIAAGAISSTEIAAGAIRAGNLASETLITQAGQLGTAVIGTAQIQDLSVGTLKVANNAISETVAAYWGGGVLDYYNWSTLAQISFNAEAGDRFQVMAQWRCYGESGYADSGGSEGGQQRYDFYWLVRVLVDGGEWYFARGNYEAWPSYINVIAFGAGGHSITLQGIEQSGEVYSAYVSATRLKR